MRLLVGIVIGWFIARQGRRPTVKANYSPNEAKKIAYDFYKELRKRGQGIEDAISITAANFSIAREKMAWIVKDTEDAEEMLAKADAGEEIVPDHFPEAWTKVK